MSLQQDNLRQILYSISTFSRPEVFCKKGGLKTYTEFTGKHLLWSLFLIKFTCFKQHLWTTASASQILHSSIQHCKQPSWKYNLKLRSSIFLKVSNIDYSSPSFVTFTTFFYIKGCKIIPFPQPFISFDEHVLRV